MRLQSLTYSEYRGTEQEWVIEGLTLGPSNLIVGKNACGKTRALNVISGLSRIMMGLMRSIISGHYDCQFIDGKDEYRYQLSFENEQVQFERLLRNAEVLLDRGKDGEGTIRAEQLDGGRDVQFQTPTSQLAAVNRRDAIQHKFLEPLYEWASSVRHYFFGTALGKDNFAIIVPQGPQADERDPNAVVALFRRAERNFKQDFVNALIQDLARIDYNVTNVGVGPPTSIRFSGTPGELVGLYVNEVDLPGITDQHSMSQGMFRTLALLIHLNYYQLKKGATCILVDDIGEGLDFDRSCRLIDLLREKATQQDVQIVLSTNDRFVMNRVPLEEWSVLQRKRNHVYVKNYINSKELFEEFKFTGLSNFSFFETDFINEASASTKH